MEIIIGRDAETSKLKLTEGKQNKTFGANGSVPQSVSRQHCSLTLNDDGSYQLKNLNAQNVTFVNGVPVTSKRVKETDVIEMGNDHFPLEWRIVNEIKPKVANISHLQVVWEEYDRACEEINIKERRINSLRSGLGILSMGAIALGFVIGRENAGLLYVLLYGTAIVLSVGFFIKSMIDAAGIPKKKKELTNQYKHDYSCPNCGRFLNQSWDQLKLYDSCPFCKVKFIK